MRSAQSGSVAASAFATAASALPLPTAGLEILVDDMAADVVDNDNRGPVVLDLGRRAESLRDREISRQPFISERTVHHHDSTVLAKIGVSSRTAAALEVARMGIQTPV
jgi:DNA-binding NarL/FixJ family response regulator